MIVVAPDGRILQANRAARLWANAGDDLVGRNCHAAFPCATPCDAGDRACPIPAVLAQGEPVKVTHRYAGPGTSQSRYVDVIASPVRDASGRIIAVIKARRDVTEERRLAELLVRRNEHLSALDFVARTVNQSLDLSDM